MINTTNFSLRFNESMPLMAPKEIDLNQVCQSIAGNLPLESKLAVGFASALAIVVFAVSYTVMVDSDSNTLDKYIAILLSILVSFTLLFCLIMAMRIEVLAI